ncbi:MAG: hypothetical protein OEZ06_28775 [Myxococcales bacterium]|nr:hypothetical protein [Myxococcales bacterium]
MMRSVRSSCRVLGWLGVLSLWGQSGAAQVPSVAGSYRAGATEMVVAVESWGPDCGPRPQSSRSGGGGTVEVSVHGNQLHIDGGERKVRSGECWSMNPTMRRQGSSHSDSRWTTRCRTPKADPREEEGIYELERVGDDQLVYRDRSRFNWKLKQSTCIATITTTQRLQRLGQKHAATASQTETETATCAPGAAARISLRPNRARISPGERVCFRTVVKDEKRCPLPDAEASLQLETPPGARASLQGRCFVASAQIAEAEGSFVVVARHGRLQDQAQVEVSAGEFGQLVAEPAASTARPSATPAAAASDEAHEASGHSRLGARALGADTDGGRTALWLGLFSLLGTGFGIGLWMRRARRRAVLYGASEEDDSATDAATDTSEQALEEAPVGMGGAGASHICPVCRQGFDGPAICPRDQSETIAYEEFRRERLTQEADAAHRRCPQCEKRYPATVQFCGIDGSELVD